MVINPVSGRHYAKKWIFSNCCCACSLRIGSLVISWIELIGNSLVLLIVLILFESGKSVDRDSAISISSHGVSGVAGLLTIIGGLRKMAGLVWASVYIHLFLLIWNIVWIIIFTVSYLFIYMIWQLIQVILVFYIFLLFRSYGYQMEAETIYQMEDESGVEVFEMDAEDGRSISQMHIEAHTASSQQEVASTSPIKLEDKTTDQVLILPLRKQAYEEGINILEYVHDIQAPFSAELSVE